MDQVVRYAQPDDLTEAVAERLLARLVELQQGNEEPIQLCLTGGRIANRVYQAFVDRMDASPFDPTRIELWWGDERFVATEDPERHAGHTLAILARKLPVSSAKTHPMPAADGIADSAAAAAAYARELGDTAFDICLLGMGTDGHVASVFPGHPSFAETTHSVIGVNDAPKAPSSRISLSIPTLNRSREVWYIVSGADKAEAVSRAHAGDETVPGGVVRGSDRTMWFLDRDAASRLPYHECSF